MFLDFSIKNPGLEFPTLLLNGCLTSVKTNLLKVFVVSFVNGGVGQGDPIDSSQSQYSTL